MEKLKTKYEKELQALKPWDEVQSTRMLYAGIPAGYSFIETAGHGYLVVPKENKGFKTAEKICEYGFKGKHAVYLEEDCEISTFEQVEDI